MMPSFLGRAAAALAAAAAVAPLAAAAPPSQLNIHYTQAPGTLSIDFVSASADGTVEYGTSANPASFTNASTTSFAFDEVGVLHQGLLPFAASPAGASAFYRVCSAGECSAVLHVVPNVAPGKERFAVYGDFGIINDESMTDLIAEAAKGSYDSVLHVGDWAYDLDALASTVGNVFMATATYMAIKPVAVVEGNHESCGFCLQNVPEIPYSVGNFTHYKARFHSVSLNSNSGNNRYYSFERGLTHFLVFTAESYVYSVNAEFNANQVAFMKADLAGVDRKRTPWVVALVHKDWTMQPDAFADFNSVLEGGGVDLLFCGHVHYYNRYLPFDAVTGETDTAAANADGSVYTNPKFMVTIVSGASGDIEGDDGCGKDTRPSFTCSENYGWGIFTPMNATVATWSFHTVSADGPGPKAYSDALTIVSNHRVSTL